MRFYFKIFVLLLLGICFCTPISAQSAKSFYKLGNKDVKAKNYSSAVTNYSKALELKPGKYSYILARAVASEKSKNLEAALSDYQLALIQKPKEETFLKIADIQILLEEYKDALATLDKFLEKKKYHIEALQKSAFCNIMMRRFKDAENDCNVALEENKYNHKTHYLRAVALDSSKEYGNAVIEYSKAITLMKTLEENRLQAQPKYKPYYIDLAVAQHHLKQYDEAIKDFNTGLDIEKADTVLPKNYIVFYQRSLSYLEKSDYNGAIGDLNKSIVLNPKYIPTFYQRGMVYKKTSQNQSAISDFTKIIVLDPKNADAYRERGISQLDLNNFKDAINDLTQCITLNPKDYKAKGFLKEATDKNYKANKEDIAPEIRITYPVIDNNNFVNVYFNQKDAIIEGMVNDKSGISSITVNGKFATFDKSERNPSFVCDVPLYNVNKIDIEATDIYNNKSSKSMKVGRIIDDARLKVTFSGTLVTDDENKVPFANRLVNITNEKGEVMYTVKTDASGRFRFDKLPFDKNYLLAMDVEDTPFASTKKFVILNENRNPVLNSQVDGKGKFNFRLLQMDQNVMSLMTVDEGPLMIDLKGKLLGSDDQKTPITNITLLLLNPKGEILSSKKTDMDGKFNFPSLTPGINYSFKIFEADSKNIPFNKIYITDENGRVIKEITKDQFGFFKFELLPAERHLLSTIAAEDTDPWMATFKLNTRKNELLIIENIYYESGSFKILPEGEALINKAVDALKNNPNLTLEVQSHTDAVAGDDYNMELSQKRANTVVEYIISKGVEKNRVSGKGFGETQLANRCANGVECSDAEHKQNRRTVFKINYSDKIKK